MNDVKKLSGLYQRKDGTWAYRKAFPEDVRKRAGKREFIKSFNTKDRAVAIPLYHETAAAIEGSIAGWRTEDSNTPTSNEVHEPATIVARPSSRAVADFLADHKQAIIDQNFVDNAAVTERINADIDAFWRGEIVKFPDTDYFTSLMEEPNFDHVVGYLLRNSVNDRLADLVQPPMTGPHFYRFSKSSLALVDACQELGVVGYDCTA